MKITLMMFSAIVFVGSNFVSYKAGSSAGFMESQGLVAAYSNLNSYYIDKCLLRRKNA